MNCDRRASGGQKKAERRFFESKGDREHIGRTANHDW